LAGDAGRRRDGADQFANPAVTIARGLTDTFAAIRPQGVPGFIPAQLLGTIAAVLLVRWLMSDQSARAQSAISRGRIMVEG
jgi:glycerol uptake facilitator-like aquaporin